MASELALAHIEGERRLRHAVVAAIERIWNGLAGHDRADIPAWLAAVLPLVLGAQRQSVALTEAYLSHAIGRAPLGVSREALVGAGIRGIAPAEVYERPFVTLWSALKEGRGWEDANAKALERATSTAETDVQLSMTHTLRAVGEADDVIVGFQRVSDADACEFCRVVAGQRYKTHELAPIHNRCGCGVDVITEANRHEFTGNPKNDLRITEGDLTVEIREHGELGPVLTNAEHHFEQLPA